MSDSFTPAVMIWNSTFLIIGVCLWVYFIFHSVVIYNEHYEYQKRIIHEAKVIMQTVCGMSREDIAGSLVDCEDARHKAFHTSAVLVALEHTASATGKDILVILSDGVQGASSALGFMGCVICIVMYCISIVVRVLFKNMHSRITYKDHAPYSEMALRGMHSSVCITELGDGDGNNELARFENVNRRHRFIAK